MLEYFKKTFLSGSAEDFEDGKENDFTRQLRNDIKKFGKSAIDALLFIITGDYVNNFVAGEALRWIASINDRRTYTDRVNFLQRCLFHSSYYVREGAVWGLSLLNDPVVISSLRFAYDLEQEPIVKQDILIVINALGNGQNDLRITRNLTKTKWYPPPESIKGDNIQAAC